MVCKFIKIEDEEWTASKLCQLLGKHISAMEMASLEFSQTPKHHPRMTTPNETISFLSQQPVDY